VDCSVVGTVGGTSINRGEAAEQLDQRVEACLLARLYIHVNQAGGCP